MRYALDHDPGLLAKRATVANLESTFVKQRATEYPAINGTLANQSERSGNYEGTLAQYGVTPENTFSQNTAAVTAQWTLYNGSLNQVLAQEDRRQLEAGISDLHTAEYQTTVEVTGDFYSLVAKRETVVLDLASRVYQQQLLDAAQANERVGRTAGVDTLRAQVALTRAQAALLTAQADEANSREALAQRIGAPLSVAFALPPVPPEPPLPQTPVERMIEIAQTYRPEVASAIANLRAAVLSNAAIDTDLLPQVTLNGSFGNQFSPTTAVSEQQQIDSANAAALAQYQLLKQIAPSSVVIPPPVIIGPVPRGNPGFWQIGATATWTVPVIDYGTRSSAHRAARAQIASADSALSSARGSTELDVRRSLRDAQTASANLQLAKESAALARESARIAQLQFKAGLISFTDVNSTEQTSLSAQNDLVNAGTNYVVSLVRLRVAIGNMDPVTAAAVK